MITDRNRLLLVLALSGCALLLFASPFGDWLGGLVKRPESPTAAEFQLQAAKLPLPTLRLRRDLIKTPSPPNEETLGHSSGKSKTPAATLANEEIEDAIQQRQSLFQRCWTQRLKDNPALVGRLLLQFEISPRGRVQDVQVAESTIPDQTMIRCVVSVLERISFREFGGGAINLTFPLSFE